MKPLYFSLQGNIPSKKNSRRIFKRQGKIINIPSEAYDNWRLCNRGKIQEQLYKQVEQDFLPIDRAVFIYVSFYYRTMHRKDSDNSFTSLLDFLVDCEILKDDSWQIVRGFNVMNYKAKKDACDFCIMEY